jgi:hypothetical protein
MTKDEMAQIAAVLTELGEEGDEKAATLAEGWRAESA